MNMEIILPIVQYWDMTIGERIESLINEHKITKSQLSDRSGVDLTYLSRIMSGSSRLKTKTPYSSLKNKAYNSLFHLVTFLLTFTFPFGKLNS